MNVVRCCKTPFFAIVATSVAVLLNVGDIFTILVTLIPFLWTVAMLVSLYWYYDYLWLRCKHGCARFDNKQSLIRICRKGDGRVLQYVKEEIRNHDPEVVGHACTSYGLALQYTTHELQMLYPIIVRQACEENGMALRYAAPILRMDKEIVIAAVKSKPEALKYALNGLAQDPDCLVAAQLWDDTSSTRIGSMGRSSRSMNHVMAPSISKSQQTLRNAKCTGSTALSSNTVSSIDAATSTTSRVNGGMRHIVLSTKFSLGENCTSTATQFTVLLKQHPYIQNGNFTIYSPNAFDKTTCDPEWTNIHHPCRGTFETCQIPHPEHKTGEPSHESCWRYSFRYQLQLAKQTNGLMIQLAELYNYDQTIMGSNSGDARVADIEGGNCISGCQSCCNDFISQYLHPSGWGCCCDCGSSSTWCHRRDSEEHRINDESTRSSSGGTMIVAQEDYALGKGQTIETEMATAVGTRTLTVYQPCLPAQHDLDLSHIDNVVACIKKFYDDYDDDNREEQQRQQEDQRPHMLRRPTGRSSFHPNSFSTRKSLFGRTSESTDPSSSEYNPFIEFFTLEEGEDDRESSRTSS